VVDGKRTEDSYKILGYSSGDIIVRMDSVKLLHFYLHNNENFHFLDVLNLILYYSSYVLISHGTVLCLTVQ
jgi:hypothetical protein